MWPNIVPLFVTEHSAIICDRTQCYYLWLNIVPLFVTEHVALICDKDKMHNNSTKCWSQVNLSLKCITPLVSHEIWSFCFTLCHLGYKTAVTNLSEEHTACILWNYKSPGLPDISSSESEYMSWLMQSYRHCRSSLFTASATHYSHNALNGAVHGTESNTLFC